MSPDEALSPAVDPERLGDVSRGRLLATITGMTTPVVLGQLSQTLMGRVDTLMVGQGQGRDGEVGSILTTAVTVSLGAGSVFMLLGLIWPHGLISLITAGTPILRLMGLVQVSTRWV